MKKGILILCLMLSYATFGQTGIRTKAFNLEKGLAIKGYDPVAYFTQQKAVKGKKRNSGIC